MPMYDTRITSRYEVHKYIHVYALYIIYSIIYLYLVFDRNIERIFKKYARVLFGVFQNVASPDLHNGIHIYREDSYCTHYVFY